MLSRGWDVALAWITAVSWFLANVVVVLRLKPHLSQNIKERGLFKGLLGLAEADRRARRERRLEVRAGTGRIERDNLFRLDVAVILEA